MNTNHTKIKDFLKSLTKEIKISESDFSDYFDMIKHFIRVNHNLSISRELRFKKIDALNKWIENTLKSLVKKISPTLAKNLVKSEVRDE